MLLLGQENDNMVRRRDSLKTEHRENMRGGAGTVSLTHYADSGEMLHCRLLSDIVIPAGAGIGEHEHNKETEYYLIIEGTGIVMDDGKDTAVGPGDVVITGNGATHSIRNSGNSDLRMIAVILVD